MRSVEQRASNALGGHLAEGEVLTAAVSGRSRRWYTSLLWWTTDTSPGERDFYVALTNQRLLLVLWSRDTATRANLIWMDAPIGEVEIERYYDNILGFWRLRFVERGARWDIRGVSGRRTARTIAEKLGWSRSS